MKKPIKLYLTAFWILPVLLWGIETEVQLQYDGDPQLRQKIEQRIAAVLNACNKSYESGESVNDLKPYFIDGAFEEFTDLLASTRLYATEPAYRGYILESQSGMLEVRNIRVRVFMGNTGGTPYQYLVFSITPQGQINHINFTIEQQQYHEIIEGGKALNDLANREKILHFIELYRTAYNRKNHAFIERTLSDDALVIVGNVITTQPPDNEYLRKSYLSREQIRFITLKKQEYLQRLTAAFANNDFVQVTFDKITINRHPRFDQIYGVQLKQRWNASNYSDEGFLFLMMDFIQPEEPIVHVRAWQPERFEDGSTVSIFDFDIIE